MIWLSCLNLGLLTWEDCCNNWLLHIVLIFVMSGLSINGKHGTKTFLLHCLEYHYLDIRWLTRTWERKIITLAYFFTHAFKAFSWKQIGTIASKVYDFLFWKIIKVILFFTKNFSLNPGKKFACFFFVMQVMLVFIILCIQNVNRNRQKYTVTTAAISLHQMLSSTMWFHLQWKWQVAARIIFKL